MSEFLMSNYSRFASNTRSMSFGAHQLVSEPLSPLIEGNREGSSGHGDSGELTGERQTTQIHEDRFVSIENTLGALLGTVLDLSGRFDNLSIRLNKFGGKFERMMEELTSSNRNPEVLNQQFISPPITHYTMVAQSPFSSIQMSNSPVNANFIHPWSGSPPVMHKVMSVHEQTYVGTLISQQNPISLPMGSMTSGHECLLMSRHKESETRIQILTSIAQKYRGGSKSSEERLQILTAAVQKYKVNRDSKSIEQLLPKPSDELLNVSSTVPSSNKVLKESSSVNYSPTAVHTKEVEARPIRAMKPSVSSVVRVDVQSIASDLPKFVEGLKDLQDDFMTKVQNYSPSHNSSDHFVADGTVLGEHVSSTLPVINRVTGAKQSEVPQFVQLHSKPTTKKWVAENIGYATCKRGLLFVLIWDPGILSTCSHTKQFSFIKTIYMNTTDSSLIQYLSIHVLFLRKFLEDEKCFVYLGTTHYQVKPCNCKLCKQFHSSPCIGVLKGLVVVLLMHIYYICNQSKGRLISRGRVTRSWEVRNSFGIMGPTMIILLVYGIQESSFSSKLLELQCQG